MARSIPRFALLLVALALAGSALLGCGSQQGTDQSPPAASPGTTAPDGAMAPDGDAPVDADAGSALVDEHCTRCHDRSRIDAAVYDREGWTQTVQRMKANGLEISSDDEDAVIDYLVSRDN